MRLKTTQTDACQEALIRGGFETTDRYSSSIQLRPGGDKPGVVCEVWFPRDGYRRDYFIGIYKGTVAASKINGGSLDWDFSSNIKLRFV